VLKITPRRSRNCSVCWWTSNRQMAILGSIIGMDKNFSLSHSM